MKKSENRRIQNVLKYFMLCIIVYYETITFG